MKTFRTGKSSIFMLVFFSLSLLALSQQDLFSQAISGTVSDENGNPLPGVNVYVTGTTKGTVTDVNGNYSLETEDENASISFSFIGYNTRVVPIEGQSVIDVQLELDTQVIEEVVKIGYGSVDKEDLTGAVAVISQEDLTRIPIPTVSKALQGKASGVTVLQSGEPGGGEVNIRVRGIGSITQDPDPLVVIDGVIGGNMNSVPPQDIESISVLKDASAAAIYGANAANGVILITTRRGQREKMKVSVSAYTGTHLKPRQYDLMNADEYAAFYTSVYQENGVEVPVAYTDDFRKWYYKEGWEEGTDWQNEILQDSRMGNYYVGISDGSERANFNISANYYHEDGILLNTNTRRINLRANSDFRISDFLKVGESLSLTRNKWRSSSGSAWNMVMESSPLMRVYNENNKEGFEGSQVAYDYDSDEDGEKEKISNTGGNDKFNPKGYIAIPEDMNYSDNLLASVYVEIIPFEGLTFTSTPAVTASFNEESIWVPAYDMGVRSVKSATLDHNFSKNTTLSLENKLSYQKDFGKHKINALAVHHVRTGENTNSDVSAAGFPYEQLNVISQSDPAGRIATGGEGEWSQLSYLGRLIYDFDNTYLITASIRRDGSSNFGKAYKWGTFPSFSVGWKINEVFLQNVNQINMFKLRAGYGATGNSNIGGFRYQTNLASLEHFSPIFGIDQKEVLALNELWNVGNPLIKWEAAKMTNVGVDLNTFSNRLQVSAEYYIKKQDDLIMEVPISSVFGKWNDVGVFYNIAETENRGFEFDISFRKMEGAFNYRVYANLTTLKNKVLDMPSSIIDDNNITRVGHTIGSIYGWIAEGIIQQSDFDEEGNYLWAIPSEGVPEPGDLRFRDLNNDGVITDADRTIIGKAIPDFTYSFGFELYYRNFDLSVFMYGIQDADIYNTLRRDIESFETQDLDHNKSAVWAKNYFTLENPGTEYLRIDPNNTNLNTRISTWWVEDASFLRMKDVQLGYNFAGPVLQRTGLQNFRVYISGMNLLTFTKYSGRDPESPLNSDEPTLPGVDSDAYPIPKTITAGLQIDF